VGYAVCASECINFIAHTYTKSCNARVCTNGFYKLFTKGDLGLSTRITEERNAGAIGRPITAEAMTCLGTPEFMVNLTYIA
jgi:hypothetical protein